MLLDPYDCHVDARVGDNGLTASCLHQCGLEYLWKGLRATHGLTKGVFMYEVKWLADLFVDMPESKPQDKHVLRCGFSQPLTSLFLGDSDSSWGVESTARRAHNGGFKAYASQFRAGDVIGCILDMNTCTISFLKNGEFMGVAFDSVPKEACKTGIFPHLMMKNVKVQVNFLSANRWFDPPGPQVKFFGDADLELRVANPCAHPPTFLDCEMLMMIGLPGSGKTFWADMQMEDHPTKNYELLGLNSVIDQMTGRSLNRRRNFGKRWEELAGEALPILDKLLEVAAKTPRNIILDQCNLYRNTRRRKASLFALFGTRQAVCLVTDETTLRLRTEKREHEEGKICQREAMMDMRKAFMAPEIEDGFSEIVWPEYPEKSALDMIGRIKAGTSGWPPKRVTAEPVYYTSNMVVVPNAPPKAEPAAPAPVGVKAAEQPRERSRSPAGGKIEKEEEMPAAPPRPQGGRW